VPFASTLHRDTHFAKHGHKFGAADPLEYERMADQFMFGAMDSDTKECMRPRSTDRFRFGFVIHLAGVVALRTNFLRTFFPVEPRVIARHRDEAGYFAFECARKMG
jgi:hypothetical protein